MKKCLLSLLFAITLPGMAEIIEFQLSPAGTDAAVGLSPLNVVPPAAGSLAHTQELSDSPLYFDTDLSVLSFGFAYLNMSGSVTSLGIHGPAGVGQNADQLIDLAPSHLPLFGGAGFVVGDVDVPPGSVPDLLQGRLYLSLSSAVFSMGELRGQLIPALPANAEPTVTCLDAGTAECGALTTVTAEVADPDGDPLVVVWDWNGWPVQTNWVGASAGSTAVTFTAEFSEDGVLSVGATDPGGLEAGCSTAISILDTTPPVIESAQPSRSLLWPPNHKMVPVSVEAVVTDTCSSTAWGIVQVSSNEETEGKGDGRSARDWEIVDDHTVLLRAERSGRGDGRVYTLELLAVDASDNLSQPYQVQVIVPH